MTTFCQQLLNTLQTIDRPGHFCVSGCVDVHIPRIEVIDVDAISIPLLPTQAEQLLKVAELAPYGRGSETIVDTKVRNTWQVDAQKITITGRYWHQDLEKIVNQVTTGLGVTEKVIAEPYKLLIYNTGSFFITHRDTEKAPGMFATLVMVLPCDYQGGTLRVEHNGREERIDLHPTDPSEVAFAAFYADCRHEVLPISSGYRIALIYNLLRKGKGAIPQPPDYAPQQTQLENLLRSWVQNVIEHPDSISEPDSDEYDDDENYEDEEDENYEDEDATTNTNDSMPVKLVYPLEHAYTQAELDFHTLKGADSAIATVLNKACVVTDCDCYLALLTICESGYAEYSYDDEYEIGEVTDSSYFLEQLRHPNGQHLEIEQLKFKMTEVCPPNALQDMEDAEPEFEEATGNAGASFERTYQRAVLVVWPRHNRGRIIANGGLHISISFLSALAQRWKQQGRIANAQDYTDAMQLAQQIKNRWPKWEYDQHTDKDYAKTFLETLEVLGDVEQRLSFITKQLVNGKAYNTNVNEELVKLLRQISPPQASELLNDLLTKLGKRFPESCAKLLNLCTAPPAITNTVLQPAAQLFTKILPRTSPKSNQGAITQALITYTLIALERIDPSLAQKTVQIFLDHPQVYSVDEILVNAALSLYQQHSDMPNIPTSFATLRHAAIEFLTQRLSIPLNPPADWLRECNIDCNCKHCTDLKKFLADAKTSTWELRAAEADRKHVTYEIEHCRCDLDLSTNRKGRPYGLTCIKNQATYERQREKRQHDIQRLKNLQVV